MDIMEDATEDINQNPESGPVESGTDEGEEGLTDEKTDYTEEGDEEADEEQEYEEIEAESAKSSHEEEVVKDEEPKKSIFEEEWEEMEGELYEMREGGTEEDYGELGETVEEEGEGEVEEGPPDPSAPYNLTDSSEALKAPFELRADQLAEVEALWALFQDYTPAYTEIDDYITETELVYMLKSLNLMTYTPEQLMELIVFCVRPPHPNNHVNFQQFVHIVTIRQRDMPQEEEIRLALEVFDPEKTGIIDREYLREQIGNTGHKMKNIDNFIKEVDMSNDGTLGIEDIVGTICIDLNRDDILMLMDQINPPEERNDNIDNLI